MEEIKIVPMNLEKDKPEIQMWDTLFKGSPKYESIYNFILEHGMLKHLGELIEANYERFKIGTNEAKKAFTIKTNDDKIIGFFICTTFDMNSSWPIMFLQYIVLHPNYQEQGYGSQIFQTLFSDPKKYLEVKPKEVFAKVDEENIASLYLFKKFGFKIPERDPDYSNILIPTAEMKAIEQAIEQNQFI